MSKSPKGAGKLTPAQKYGFLWRLMADDALSPAAKCVATALLLKFRNAKTGRCNPGVPGIAKTAGISRRAVYYAIAELKDAGWITIESIGGGSARNSNRYSFDFKRMKSATPPTGANNAPLRGAKSARVQETTLRGANIAPEPSITTRPPGGGCVWETPPPRACGAAGSEEGDRKGGADFKVLFKIWDDANPDGTDEEIGLKAFNRAIGKGAEPHLIIEGARQWVDALEPRYLPALERWLARRAWRKPPAVRKANGHHKPTAADEGRDLVEELQWSERNGR